MSKSRSQSHKVCGHGGHTMCRPIYACAGDSRVNEQSVLAVIHTLWMREHNRIESILHQVSLSDSSKIIDFPALPTFTISIYCRFSVTLWRWFYANFFFFLIFHITVMFLQKCFAFIIFITLRIFYIIFNVILTASAKATGPLPSCLYLLRVCFFRKYCQCEQFT